MITLKEHIRVQRPADEAFAYVADFSNTAEWDSTVIRALRLNRGSLAVGTEFLVTCALPLGSVDLTYTITHYDPPRRLVLAGKGRFFDVLDTITFETTGEVTEVSYRADFTFRSLFKPLIAAMRPGLERMGRASVAGLRQALEDRFPPPATSGDAATHGGVASVARFTRYGFQRARKAWHPISADLRGKHAVISGTSSGLGLVTARELARRGATLTLVMRNRDRAEAVRDELAEDTGNRHIHVEVADLSLLQEVDKLTQRLLDRADPVHILVNNAGALYNEWEMTDEGLERSIALLLLSPYRLTLALKPLLVAARHARVINVVSGGMYTQRLSMQNLVANSAEAYSGAVAYARAKRALMVVTQCWADEWRGDGIAVNAMHPGWADTPGVETSLPRFHTMTRFALRSPEEGADTIVWLAAATEAGELSGELFLDRQPQPLHLVKSTRESDQERRALQQYLSAYTPEIALKAVV